MPLVAYLAIVLGLVPLLWVAYQWGRNPHVCPGRHLWLIAAAFAVSFVADVAALHGHGTLAGNLYPMSQAGLIGFALLGRWDAEHFLGLLLVVAVVAVCWKGVEDDDILLNTVAGLAIAGLGWRLTGALRWSLILAFGLGTLGWWWLAADPGWPSWIAYQACRALGTGAFVWTASRG